MWKGIPLGFNIVVKVSLIPVPDIFLTIELFKMLKT
jgi:hypothetical protein